MGIQVRWHDQNQTIILWEIANPITIDDFFAKQDEVFKVNDHPLEAGGLESDWKSPEEPHIDQPQPLLRGDVTSESIGTPG